MHSPEAGFRRQAMGRRVREALTGEEQFMGSQTNGA